MYSIIFNSERSKVVTFLTYHVEDIWIGAAVAPQNLPSWFRLMFHHKHHIALHSYIVMGSKYFGYQVFLKLWRLIALTSCSSRTLSSKPLDLSSSKVIAYLKIFYPSLWIIRGLKFVFDYKKNHSFDSPVKLGFCLIKAIDQCTSLDLEATTSHWYLKSLCTRNWSRCPEDLKFWRWFISLLRC